MIQFYQLLCSAPCRSVKMLAKALNVHLKYHRVDVINGQQFKPDFLKINPFHKVPTIMDGEFKLYESVAIMLYFLDKFDPNSKLYPKDIKERAIVDQMLYTQNGSIFPALTDVLTPMLQHGVDPPEAVVKKAQDILGSLNTVLSSRDFAAGKDLTLADYSIAPTLETFAVTKVAVADYPSLDAYLKRVSAELRPVYSEVNDPGNEMLRVVIEQKRKLFSETVRETI